MGTQNVKRVYVDSGFIKTQSGRYIIKTGIVVVEPNLPESYFISTRFVKSEVINGNTILIEADGVTSAYSLFGENALYFNDSHELVKHKYKVVPKELADKLSWASRWTSEMLIADSILKRKIKNRIHISNDIPVVVVVRRHGKTILIYEYGKLVDIKYQTKPWFVQMLKKMYPQIRIIPASKFGQHGF